MVNGNMTPEELEMLNKKIAKLPVIMELQHNDSQIMKELLQLKSGQVDIEDRLDKGAKRMDGIEGEVRQVREMLTLSDQKRDMQHEEIKNKIVDNEIQRLKRALDDRERRIEVSDSRKWEIIKMIIAAVVGIAAGGFAASIGIK